jgi:CRP/FNR family cyclic AMP-dependent transcriptional regulator
MNQLLQRTAGLPEVKLAAGEVLVREGESGDGLWILLTGALQVSKSGTAISQIRGAGAAVGEIALLLNSLHSATVVAIEPSTLRYAADGHALLMNDPTITRLIATGLAERLAFATTYLADLKNQYADAPGLAMVSEVLDQMAHRPPGRGANAGSVRDPHPDN